MNTEYDAQSSPNYHSWSGQLQLKKGRSAEAASFPTTVILKPSDYRGRPSEAIRWVSNTTYPPKGRSLPEEHCSSPGWETSAQSPSNEER